MSSDAGKNTAKKIVHGATELFSTQSFDAVSIKEIAARAGVNSAMISYYFGGKANLYKEVLSIQADAFLNTIIEIDKKNLPPLEKIKAFMDQETEIQFKNDNFIHVIYNEMLSPTAESEEVGNERLFKIHDYLVKFIAQAIQEGTLRRGLKPEALAFSLESMVAFFFMAKEQIMNYHQQDSITSHKYFRAFYLNLLESLQTGEE